MRSLAPLCCLVGLLPASVVAQARIETIIPADARVVLNRLGADRAERAAVGMELTPGDLLEAGAGGVSIGLTCGGPEETNAYLVSAPFRVLIDVPTTASCHVNLLSGLTEVVAEAPTETTAGGVTLGSTGTQYAVEMRRRGNALVFNCFVYDEAVRVLGRPGLEATAGQKLVWADLSTVDVRANTSRDVARSAATYARFDLASASARGTAVADTTAMLRTLTSLHMDVLAHPADTAKRVALAKEQLRWDVRDRAMYNLERVDVRDASQLRRYQIDESLPVGRLRTAAARPGDAVLSRAEPSPARPTTDGDLRLIAEGRVEEAIANLETRVESGYAGSRDHFALAKAYAVQGSEDRMREHAGRALVLHAGDGELSSGELRELGELIARQD